VANDNLLCTKIYSLAVKVRTLFPNCRIFCYFTNLSMNYLSVISNLINTFNIIFIGLYKKSHFNKPHLKSHSINFIMRFINQNNSY
jgi:hypothetical protein